jgi:tRNA(Ile)-lysidine synthase
MSTIRPRLTPAMADVRRAVREMFADIFADASGGVPPADSLSPAVATDVKDAAVSPVAPDAPLVLVALSGGPDSLALAAATAFEAPRAGLRAGVVIVDHQLQDGSAAIAEMAATQARALGLDPVLIRAVEVGTVSGPEAAARTARYAALVHVRAETGATAVLLGHTLDDQAETVLLGLTRGAGPTSIGGMSRISGFYLRPLLGIRRATTVAACADQRLEPWNDPHNIDVKYARVRIRHAVMPVLETELGPGIAEALARTAEHLREDAATLDSLANDMVQGLIMPGPGPQISLDANALADAPRAIHTRVIRIVAHAAFGVSLTSAHTSAVALLVTDWHGQGAAYVPGIRVERQGFRLVFMPTESE